MNIRFGSQTFRHVSIPLLWGSRAVIGHPNETLSIIDLSRSTALPEVIIDKPAPEIEYAQEQDGFTIYSEGTAAFFYSPGRKLIRDLRGSLPECEVTKDQVRVGTNTIQQAIVVGSPVGIGVNENGFFIGGPMPPASATCCVTSYAPKT